MKTFAGVLAVVLGAGVSGCAERGAIGGDEDSATSQPGAAGTSSLARDEAVVSDVKLKLERAARNIDRGKELASTQVELSALLADPAVTDDEKDAARLSLSRVYAALGDDDAAIEVIEELLAAPNDNRRGGAREEAEKRLRFLLTGAEDERDARLPATTDPAPMAKALAREFKPDAEGHVLVDVFAFGRGRGDDHGLFDIAEAKRIELEQDLSSKIDVGQSISSAGSWVALPRAMGEKEADMPQADRSLLVFYYDLGDLKVPSRYDAYLPLPSEEVAAALERGEGLVAARAREHGHPTIVIAAPRRAQLELVEAAFAQMNELPFRPVTIPLEKKLLPAEIQAVVRGARGPIKGCYVSALERQPDLAGTLKLMFEISGDGTVASARIGQDSTLSEPGLSQCVLKIAGELRFPATGGAATSVTYPLSMSP